MPGFFDPLVPKEAIDPLQQWLEQRRLDQSPMEAQIKGFGSGALEGLRSLTSPANLASMIPGGAAAKMLSFAPKVARMAGPTMDLLERAPVRQVAPSMDDVGALVGSMKHNLAKIPPVGMRQRVRQYMPTEFQQPLPGGGPVQGLKSAAGIDPFAEEMVTKYLRKIR